MERATGEAAVTTRGLAWQLFAYLGGMTAYAVHLMGGTALVPFSCDVGTRLPLTALNVAVIIVCLAALAASWSIWRRASALAAQDGSAVSRRSAFIGLSGVMLNSLAIAVVLFAEAHVWFLDPCFPR